jgi:hypothetical protein
VDALRGPGRDPRCSGAAAQPSRRLLTAGDDLLYWCEAARWAFDLLHRRRVAPAFEEAHPRWRLVLSDSHEKDRLARFVSALPPLARTASLEKGGHGTRHDTTFPAAAAVLRAFLDDVTDAGARELLRSVLPEESRDAADVGGEPELALVASLAMSAKEISQAGPPALSAEKLSRLREWSLPLLEPVEEGTLRLGIRLVPPERGDTPGAFRLRYHLRRRKIPRSSSSPKRSGAAAPPCAGSVAGSHTPKRPFSPVWRGIRCSPGGLSLRSRPPV